MIPSKLFELQKNLLSTSDMSYAEAIRICLNHPGRRETLELQKKLYKELNRMASTTPWQLRQSGTNYHDYFKKLAEGNYLCNDAAFSFGNVCKIFQRVKTTGGALLTTLALLRFKC